MYHLICPRRGIRVPAILLLFSAACADAPTSPDALDVSAGDPAAAPPAPPAPPAQPESPALPAPPTTPAPSAPAGAGLDTRSNQPGIVFGTFNMPNQYLNAVHTGWMHGGPLDPSNIISFLVGARAKGARAVIKLSKGKDSYIKNGDGTFSLTKWKSLVSRYRSINLAPYIADGTILGHFLIDEPHRTARWGGRAISTATLEEMAKYSKELWPDLATLVRVEPSYLADNHQHVDAGWVQYTVGKGDARQWVASEAGVARRKGLGLVVGLNVLDGGNGSSNIRGVSAGKWSMSANEIRTYGAAVLSESHACAFFNWQHNLSYYGRSDINGAMADVSALARNHAKTSCRQ